MLMRGRYEPAAAALLKAIELNPDFTEAHMWLGQVREKQHRLADAAEQFRVTLTCSLPIPWLSFIWGTR